jgi:hypothetical protein
MISPLLPVPISTCLREDRSTISAAGLGTQIAAVDRVADSMVKMSTCGVGLLLAGLVGLACSNSGLKGRAGDGGVASGGQAGSTISSGTAGGTGGAIGTGGFGSGGTSGTSGSATGGTPSSSGPGGVATGGTTGSGGSDRDAVGNADAAGMDGMATSSIVGSCTADSDCLLVLDYRAGFECWSPTAASLADVARDPCLVPWNPSNPRCPLVTPPSDCPGGPIAVSHSCPAYCRFAVCTSGTCTLDSDFSTPSRCTEVDAGAPPDCDALRATYFAALAAAQTCDPTKAPTSCFDAFYDSCGCPAAADLSSPQANALECALDALEQALCGFGNCGTPCPSGTDNPACTPTPTGTMGTCTIR